MVDLKLRGVVVIMFKEFIKMQREKGLANNALSKDELYAFQKMSNEQLGFFLPFHYAQFMKVANGYKNNDKILYAADSITALGKNELKLPEYIIENFYLMVNNSKCTFLYMGESDTMRYVFDYKDNKYYGVDKSSMQKVVMYPTFESLLKEVIVGTI